MVEAKAPCFHRFFIDVKQGAFFCFDPQPEENEEDEKNRMHHQALHA
jgi:hypothetical protein